jgi:hypothetical protein
MDAIKEVVEFIPREEWEKRVLELQAQQPKIDPNALDRAVNPYTRKDIIDAYVKVFELMGGVLGMAVWGMENKSEFYRLHARLLPSGNSAALGEDNTIVIQHVLPKTALDG